METQVRFIQAKHYLYDYGFHLQLNILNSPEKNVRLKFNFLAHTSWICEDQSQSLYFVLKIYTILSHSSRICHIIEGYIIYKFPYILVLKTFFIKILFFIFSLDLQLSDSGLYTCTASSESGETSWSATLTVCIIYMTRKKRKIFITHIIINQQIYVKICKAKNSDIKILTFYYSPCFLMMMMMAMETCVCVLYVVLQKALWDVEEI